MSIFQKKTQFCIRKQNDYTMSEQERIENEKQLALVFQQLHLSVIYANIGLKTLVQCILCKKRQYL